MLSASAGGGAPTGASCCQSGRLLGQFGSLAFLALETAVNEVRVERLGRGDDQEVLAQVVRNVDLHDESRSANSSIIGDADYGVLTAEAPGGAALRGQVRSHAPPSSTLATPPTQAKHS